MSDDQEETITLLPSQDEHHPASWTTQDGKYKLWHDGRFVHPYRWARRDWEDDGVGLQHHGGATTLEQAAVACLSHQRLYESV